MEPLLSIMMPVYNALPLIKASIRSLQQQSYKNWECIIIDDGSNDGTSAYLDSINDKRFIVYHLPKNSGRAVARQRALELCNGEYIGMLDAEDVVHPDKFKRQIEYLESNKDCSLVTTALCSFGTKTDILLVRGVNKPGENLFNGKNYPVHAPSVYRAAIAKQCSYNPLLRFGEDQDFLEKYLSYNPKYFIISDVLYYYSELDSVNKYKIIQNYSLYIGKYFKQRSFKRSALFFMKYLYAKIVFPFLSIESILYKRGRKATEDERKEFELYCKSYCVEILKDFCHQ